MLLVGSFAKHYRAWRTCQDLDVEPGRTGSSIAKIQANHFVEGDAAATTNLPKSGDARLGLKQAAAVPKIVGFDFVGHWRPGTD